jgi:hypothetical protein
MSISGICRALKTHFIEPHIVTEVGVVVEFNVTTVYCTLTFGITSEDMHVAMLNLLSHVRKVHIVTTTGRAFYLKLIAVILVETLKGLDEEEVNGNPYHLSKSSQ